MGGTVRRRARRATVAVVVAFVVATVPACERPGEVPQADAQQSATDRSGSGGTPATPSAPSAGGPATAGAPGDPGAATDPASVSVVVSGDVLVHPPLWRTAERDAAAASDTGRRYDFRPLLAGMRPVVEGADVAICHLETPVAPSHGPYRGYPTFSVPPQILPALAWAGYDGCTTASNHSLDDSFSGLRRTIDALRAAGLSHTGTWADERSAGSPMSVTVRGATVAVIAQTYGTNGVPLPRNAPWAVRIIDPQRIIASAEAARRAGADIVLVALHWGQEYQAAPTPAQRRVARVLATSGAIDLVYGHHAHVVQPFERIGDTWVLYGLGNAVAHHATRASGVDEGVTARITFTGADGGRRSVQRMEYIPTTVRRATGDRPARIVPLATALADRSISGSERDRLIQARAAVSKTVRARGAAAHGVVEGTVPAQRPER